MKQLLSVILLAVLFTGFINAQSQWISIGGNVVLPIGSWSDVSGVGFGGTATYERSFSPNIVGQVYAGYLMFGGKDFEGGSYTHSMIPIMAGAKYFFQPGKGLYANALLGVHIYSFDVSYDDPELQAIYDQYSPSTSSTEFSFGVGAGYEMPMGKNALDLSAHFMIVSDANYIGARVAYKFGM
jgi:hypothetical protein